MMMMTTYTADAAFEKITDGIAEAPAGDWLNPDLAEFACNVYLLGPFFNEGDSFDGDRQELISRVRQWMADRK